MSAREVLVAGLDMGWDRTVSCVKENDRFVLERDLPGGRFQYKYIVDGRWTYNADAPTLCDNGNNNNYLDVVTGDDHECGVRSRVLSAGGAPAAGEGDHSTFDSGCLPLILSLLL